MKREFGIQNSEFRIKTITWLLVGLVAIGLIRQNDHASAQNESFEELRKKRSEVQRQIEENRRQANQKNQEAKKLSQELDRLAADITKTEQKIEETQQAIINLQQEINHLNDEIVLKEKELTKQRDDQAEAIRVLYETSNTHPVILIIGSATLSQAITQTSYLEAIEAKIESTIIEIERLKKQLEETKAAKLDKQAKLTDLQEQQEAYKQGLESRQADRQSLLTDARAGEKNFLAKLEEAKSLADRLDAEIARLATSRRTINRAKDKGTSPVGFIWPMDFEYTTTEFGSTEGTDYPFKTVVKFHYGLDLVNRVCGSPVYAAADGVISNLAMATPAGFYGLGRYVIVDHNARFSTLYAHLSGYGKEDGAEIKQGEVIGYEGSTGWSTGCHLHFQVLDNGSWVNPRSVLP